MEEAPLVSGDDPAEAMRAVLDSQASFYDEDKEEVTTLRTYLKLGHSTFRIGFAGLIGNQTQRNPQFSHTF
mgnify:FL=1